MIYHLTHSCLGVLINNIFSCGDLTMEGILHRILLNSPFFNIVKLKTKLPGTEGTSCKIRSGIPGIPRIKVTPSLPTDNIFALHYLNLS